MNKQDINEALKNNTSVLFSAKFIKLEMYNDGEGNPFFEIKLDDEQTLAVTLFELENLVKIFNDNEKLIKQYTDKIFEEGQRK